MWESSALLQRRARQRPQLSNVDTRKVSPALNIRELFVDVREWVGRFQIERLQQCEFWLRAGMPTGSEVHESLIGERRIYPWQDRFVDDPSNSAVTEQLNT
jgi:hypothetical protein